MHNGENMENAWKINNYRKTLSLSCELKFKFHGDLCINAHTRVVNTRAHILPRVCTFKTLVGAFVNVSS